MLRTARNEVSYLIEQSKRIYHNDKINKCKKDQKKLFEVINDLMSQKEKTKLSSGSLLELVNAFNKFFITKIENIRLNISSSHSGTSSTKHRIHCPHNLSEFDPVTEEELMKIIQGSKNATCDLDPFPTELLKKCVTVLLPYLVKLFNLSLSSGVVPISFKHAM